jgi:hypothetical protein
MQSLNSVVRAEQCHTKTPNRTCQSLFTLILNISLATRCVLGDFHSVIMKKSPDGPIASVPLSGYKNYETSHFAPRAQAMEATLNNSSPQALSGQNLTILT